MKKEQRKGWRSALKKIIKSILFSIALFVCLILLYLLMALAGTLVPTTGQKLTSGQSIEIFIQSNGMHSGWVLPLKNDQKNWLEALPDPSFESFRDFEWVAFGWGDRAFYLESKESVSLITTLRAVFLPTPSLMHLSFYSKKPIVDERCISLKISPKQYQRLCEKINLSFARRQNGECIWISAGYGKNDFFFEAKGSYHLFYTCNNWTNGGLKAMQIRTGIWTPFERCIFYWLDGSIKLQDF